MIMYTTKVFRKHCCAKSLQSQSLLKHIQTNKYSQFTFQLKPIIPGFKTELIYCSDSSDEVVLCVFWSILSFFKDCFHLKTETGKQVKSLSRSFKR